MYRLYARFADLTWRKTAKRQEQKPKDQAPKLLSDLLQDHVHLQCSLHPSDSSFLRLALTIELPVTLQLLLLRL